ncbi:MAG: tRNA (N6-threonylcarbamoyladenosine(37)-N6)-methyltransferase TrmO [Candidatus Scalindua sp.]|nr:tRNA (N6-threonylcarbamoyladenosine(37)-N6)-methyltransferase TrmO [Candidatus Scalindua sp.]
MRIKSFVLIIIFTSFAVRSYSQNKMSGITYQPIGVFHTEYNPQSGAPRQGILMPDGHGRIEIFPEFIEALQTLNLFEYIIVIYHFDEVKTWTTLVHPPGSDDQHEFGLFATRSPKRPNPIGFSVIKLNEIESGNLYVSGIDAFDGTPVLDIKHYLPSIDCIKSVQNELIESELGHHDEIFINDSSYYK